MGKVIRKIILTIGVVMLSLFIIANIFVGIGNIRDRMSGYEPGNYDSSYLWAIDDGAYMRLLSRRLEDAAYDHEVDPDYAPYQAAADYYYAAVLYKACVQTGDETGAAAQKAKMDSARAAMGSEAAYADDIDRFLDRK